MLKIIKKFIKNIDYLMRMLRPLCLRLAYRSGTDAYTDHTSQELMHALSVSIKFEKVPSKHAEHM